MSFHISHNDIMTAGADELRGIASELNEVIVPPLDIDADMEALRRRLADALEALVRYGRASVQ